MKKMSCFLIISLMLSMTACSGGNSAIESSSAETETASLMTETPSQQLDTFQTPSQLDTFEETTQLDTFEETTQVDTFEETTQVDTFEETTQVDTFMDNFEGESEVIELPILDTIHEETEIGTAGSSLKAIGVAERLCDWGYDTGLDLDEIRAGAEFWKSHHDQKTNEQFVQQLKILDEIYLMIIGVNELTNSDIESYGNWGEERIEPIEVVMDVFGLR